VSEVGNNSAILETSLNHTVPSLSNISVEYPRPRDRKILIRRVKKV
jgi:hypothetical protein